MSIPALNSTSQYALPSQQTETGACPPSDLERPTKVARTALDQTAPIAPQSTREKGSFSCTHKVRNSGSNPGTLVHSQKPLVNLGHTRQSQNEMTECDINCLPIEMIFRILTHCDFKTLVSLSRTCKTLYQSCVEFYIPIWSAEAQKCMGKSFAKVGAEQKKLIDQICRRFKTLYDAFLREEVHLPKDLIDLYKNVKSTRNEKLSLQLKKVLDERDDLILLNASGVFDFDLEEVRSYSEIVDGYSEALQKLLNCSKNVCDLILETDFSLRGLSLTSIPRILLTYCSQMNSLDLSNNYITEVSKKLGEKTSLKTLSLQGNPLTSLPKSFLKLLQKNDELRKQMTEQFPQLVLQPAKGKEPNT